MQKTDHIDVVTLGCRLNLYESALIKVQNPHLKGMVINTCAVTKEAVRKSKQTVRHYVALKNPVYVTGCGVELHHKEFAAMDGVRGVVGNGRKIQPNAFDHPDNPNHLPSLDQPLKLKAMPVFGTRTRAFVEIQNGCDHACTFCVIPTLRGKSCSLPVDQVIENIEMYVQKGYQEVVLTGVDIASYGSDLKLESIKNQPHLKSGQTHTPHATHHSLGSLMERILDAVPLLKRLRLSSVDCMDFDSSFYKVFANPRVMPFLHVSVQSGDALILKRMGRRHSPDDINNLIQKILDIRPDAMFSADIIAGFPTETDDYFNNTVQFLKQNFFYKLHVFPYSARPHTPASKIPHQIDGNIRKQRAQKLRALNKSLFKKACKSCVGKIFPVLLETSLTGRLPNFLPVTMVSPLQKSLPMYGKIIQAKVISYDDKGLITQMI